MIVIPNEHIMMVDCDDTLVMWSTTHNKPGKGKIKFNEPYGGGTVYLTPNKKHIKLLKTHKARGYAVVVWSAAGYRWAEEVVKQLKIEDFVDIVMSKSTKYVDDLEAKDILGTRIYLKD